MRPPHRSPSSPHPLISGTYTGGTEADAFKGGAGTGTATDFNPGERDTKQGVENV